MWLVVFSLLVFLACSKQNKQPTSSGTNALEDSLEIPTRMIDQASLQYHPNGALWTLNDQPYSGYAVSYYENKTLKEKFGILNGKKQNEAISYFPDGHYQYFSTYHQGKLHGEKKAWSTNAPHMLISHLNYHQGKAHGKQRKWYATGEIFKIVNLEMGREAGIQQAFRKNGVLFANYEARNGRIFGLKKAALCFGLDDEKIQYEN